VNEDAMLFPVNTVMENITPEQGPVRHSLVISKVPVVGGVTVVLPSGQVTATAQAFWFWLLLAVAVLSILFVLSAVAVELEVLSAEFVFVFVFVFGSAPLKSDFLCAKEFCIIGNIVVAPTTSIDVIATTIRKPLIVWFIFLSQ
jgi:hypothetical protein